MPSISDTIRGVFAGVPVVAFGRGTSAVCGSVTLSPSSSFGATVDESTKIRPIPNVGPDGMSVISPNLVVPKVGSIGK
eukprot:9466268-Pyramimonas_sp.AAC.1